MITGDGAYIKKINRSLILQEIMKNGFISRAELSKTTGLNKATISVQVQELLQRNLIYETHHEHNTLGRRPIMLSINENAGYILGIDLDQCYIRFFLSDLKGNKVKYKKVELETNEYHSVVRLLIENISYFQQKCADSTYGLVRVVIGVHGTVNDKQSIHFIPKLKWEKKDLRLDLMKELDLHIHIKNNANLSAFGEYAYNQGNDHMITITSTSGMGAGIIIDGQIQKGYNGYAGEVGHMIIDPAGKLCPCGNQGCWGAYSSDFIALEELSDLLEQPNLSYAEIKERIAKEDPTTINYLREFFRYISIGLNNIIHLYNPKTVVLNSELLRIYPNSMKEIQRHLRPSLVDHFNIVISEFGDKSTLIGACTWGISDFLQISNMQIYQGDNI